jgi:hypothetical protein
MKASDLFLTVSARLQDQKVTKRWPWDPVAGQASLTDMLNRAILEIVTQRPDAAASYRTLTLAIGTRQTLPTDCECLLDIVRNVGGSGTAGAPIARVDRADLDLHIPGWHASTGTIIESWAYDKMIDPTHFWVQPGCASPLNVDAVLAATPAPLTAQTGDFPLRTTFVNAAIHWMLYECLSGDNADTNFTKAVHHLSAFYQTLGIKLKADLYFPRQAKKEAASA